MTEPQPQQQDQGQQPADASEHMIPKSRFDEVNKALQELRAEKEKRAKEEATERERQARERGEFEQLATERGQRLSTVEADLGSTRERLTAYEEAMERQFKAGLSDLPEAIRGLVPEGADLLTRYQWLEKARKSAAKLQPPAPSGTPLGPRGPGAPPTGPSDADLVARKRASGNY